MPKAMGPRGTGPSSIQGSFVKSVAGDFVAATCSVLVLRVNFRSVLFSRIFSEFVSVTNDVVGSFHPTVIAHILVFGKRLILKYDSMLDDKDMGA